MPTTKPRLGAVPSASRNLLSAMEVFRSLPAWAFREVEDGGIERKYAEGDSLFQEDDEAASIWFVKEGYVKEGLHTVEGRDLTLGLIGVGGMFGTASFNGGEYGCYCLAETDAVAVSFPILRFKFLMGKCPEMAWGMVSRMSNLLRAMRNRHVFSRETVEKRVIHVIIEMAREYGPRVPMTRKAVAEMAGTTEETCIRTFLRFEESGLIAAGRGRFTVLNLEGLKRRLAE